MNQTNNHIDYIEFKAKDLQAMKTFYGACFGWTFTAYGSDYVAFSDSGLQGGIEQSDEAITNGALLILYHKDLQASLEKIEKNGGKIVKDIFEFPGGRRFHFLDPAGNELAVWSE